MSFSIRKWYKVEVKSELFHSSKSVEFEKSEPQIAVLVSDPFILQKQS